MRKGPMDVLSGYPEHSNIYISVDEGGDIGSRFDGDYYILCATAVKDRERFRKATGRLKYHKELKFRKARKHREEILTYADPAIKRVYYVAVRKNDESYSPEDQHTIHENAIGTLSDMVLSLERSPYIDVEIDHTSMISDEVAECIFEDNMFSKGRSVKAEVVESSDSQELQTHDFIVGAIGKFYNRHDDSYIGLLKCSKYGFFTDTDEMKKETQANRSLHDYADAPGQRSSKLYGYKKNVGGRSR